MLAPGLLLRLRLRDSGPARPWVPCAAPQSRAGVRGQGSPCVCCKLQPRPPGDAPPLWPCARASAKGLRKVPCSCSDGLMAGPGTCHPPPTTNSQLPPSLPPSTAQVFARPLPLQGRKGQLRHTSARTESPSGGAVHEGGRRGRASTGETTRAPLEAQGRTPDAHEAKGGGRHSRSTRQGHAVSRPHGPSWPPAPSRRGWQGLRATTFSALTRKPRYP